MANATNIEESSMSFLKIAGIVPLVAAMVGCASPKNEPAASAVPQKPVAMSGVPDVNEMRPDSMLRLRYGDTMDIRLGGVPREEIEQVTGTYVVDTQGFVNMPHLGRIKAVSLTQEQLQVSIENAYRASGLYTNPTITVSVPMLARFVNIGGEVRLPQRVAYTPDLTAVSAISAAGGLTEYASQTRIRLVRGNTVVKLDLRKIRKDPSLDVPLEPGDSIEVMRSFF
jgi:protein involved in polysaccharide export with SLBB domain